MLPLARMTSKSRDGNREARNFLRETDNSVTFEIHLEFNFSLGDDCSQ
jgi:hypothetical protein